MTLTTWWLFLGAVFVVSGTPGPNMLHILSRSAEVGFRRSVAAMTGCLLGLMALMTASAAGLTALLLTIPGAFEVLRIGGAIYLIYLGVKAWRSEVRSSEVHEASRPAQRLSNRALFAGGFMISISNPKALLFVTAFLPQFVNPSHPKAPQFAILVATFAAVESAWYVLYAAGGRSLSRYLLRPITRRVFNRVSGLIFFAFGLALLRIKPS